MQKAWVLHKVGDIRLEDVPIPQTKEGEVLIRIRAAGICGSDIPRIYETGAHRMPLVPGHEFSGVVESVGASVPADWIGKPAGVFPKIACKKCKQCRSGHPLRCLNYDYVGSRRDGAFSEYVTVPAENLLELPESVSFEEAAILEPFAVASHAIRRAMRLSDPASYREQTVVVCGLGTIGSMIVMLLLDADYQRIFAVGNKPSQRDRIKKLGLDEDAYCDARASDVVSWIKDRTDGGCDLFFECVGKNECISYGIEATAPEGDVILVGNPHSDMQFSRDVYWEILRNQIRLNGVWNSDFQIGEDHKDDWTYVLSRIKDHRIRPADLISHRFAIDELESGFLIMKNKTEDYCKIMMHL